MRGGISQDFAWDFNWRQYCESWNIGKKFHKCHLINDFDEKEAKAGMYIIKNNLSIVAHGAPGGGKTHFVLSIIRSRMWYYRNKCIAENWPIYMRMKDIDDEILENYKNYGTATDFLKKLKNTELLIIDDFGVGRSTERAHLDFFDIIDDRWANERPIYITTNLNYEDIERQYTSRILSRLKDFFWVDFSQKEDRRGN